MRRCAVKICSACGESTSNIEKNPEKCFFKYPNTPERKLEWIKRLKVDELKVTANSKVCEAHFKPNQFSRTRLIRKALPFNFDTNDKENRPPHKRPRTENRLKADSNHQLLAPLGTPQLGNIVGQPLQTLQNLTLLVTPPQNSPFSTTPSQQNERTKAQVLTGSKIKKTEHISVVRTEMQPGTPQQSNQVHSEVNLALSLTRPHQMVPKEVFSQRLAVKLNTLGSHIQSKEVSLAQRGTALGTPLRGNVSGDPVQLEMKFTPCLLPSSFATVTNVPNYQQGKRDPETLITKTNKIIYLRKQLAASKKRESRLREKVEKYKRKTGFYESFNACKDQAPRLHHWLSMQMNRWREKTSSNKYDVSERAMALTIYYSCGPSGYYTLKKFGFQLPSIRQIQRWLQKLEMKPGINEEIISILQDVCSNMTDCDRDCILMWDEMSLKEFLEYNKSKDELDGVEDFGDGQTGKPATEALTFMISGIKKNWTFPFSFYFSSKNTTSVKLKELIFSNLNAIKRVGFRVRLGVCDMSFTNQGLYRKLGVTITNPFIVYQENKIYFIHDTPHLMKLVRNNLMTKSFIVNNVNENKVGQQSIAKWKHIHEFYNLDRKSCSRMAPKLGNSHLFVKNFSKMKVKLAVQVLSHSVAAGINTMVLLKKMPKEARQTADFIQKMDDMFDILNISTDCDVYKKERSGRYLMHNLEILQTFLNYIQSISVSENTKRPNCLNGIALTLNAIYYLISDLKTEGYEYVNTRRLQQDPLENTFSFIRLKGGWNKNPSTRNFRNNFRFILIRSFVRKSSNSNCQDCEFDNSDVYLKALERFLDKSNVKPDDIILDNLRVSGTDVKGTLPSHPLLKLFDKNDYDEKTQRAENENIAVYMGTYCVKKIVKLTKCNECKLLLCNKATSFGDHTLTFNKSYNPVSQYKIFAGVSYFDTISDETSVIFKIITHQFLDSSINLLSNCSTKLGESLEKLMTGHPTIAPWVNSCNAQCQNHRRRMIKLFLRCKLFRIVQDQNDKWQKPKSWMQTRIELRNQ